MSENYVYSQKNQKNYGDDIIKQISVSFNYD